ncbi:peptidoglycan transpeptidase precursor, ErfK-YbiS-YhnG family [Clostridium sp. DSM 8431]|nr:peptidoglycan transpeptidase precursor, ErfK-YbiS-YhnG family [Clostridium sp. DSM 8431]
MLQLDYTRGIIILVCILVVAYIGTAIYFKNHFYLGSKINGVNVSGMTVEEVENLMASKFQSYSLTLEERNNQNEVITANDISLTYDSSGKIREFKDNQSSLGWIFGIFKNKSTELTDLISYDKSELNTKLSNLKGVASKDVVKPKSASVQYIDGEFQVVDEVQGNEINLDKLTTEVDNAIMNSNETLNLDNADCYNKPKYVSTDSEVSDAKEKLQKYASSSITYTFGPDGEENLDGSEISKWLSTDEDLNVDFNTAKVKKYVLNLANKYNTSSNYRNFTTTAGNVVKVVPGDYGWRIDVNSETEDLISNIEDGQTITKEPKYLQKAAKRGSSDIGDTYVEVNIPQQHIWFYKDGALVVDSDVVTGNVSAGNGTPEGVYVLKYKEKDSTLKGEDYETPVSYWMPFNGGVGFHDAYWRDAFGGTIYQTAGSHGCVNCPTEVAKALFENIQAGTPVIVYGK